jgi:hypothetical protein
LVSALPLPPLSADSPSVSTHEQAEPRAQAAAVPPARGSRAVAEQPLLPTTTEPASVPAAGAKASPSAPAIASSAHVVAGPDVHAATELPGTASPLPEHLSVRGGTSSETPAAEAKSPWGAAADAGVNVGRGSQKAAVATAGFFTRLSKSIARSF